MDETGHLHNLARSKHGEIENLDDPVSGAAFFPIESYRQGATNEISKRVQDDPLALLTFLDRLIQVEQKIEEEDKVREALMDVSPKIATNATGSSGESCSVEHAAIFSYVQPMKKLGASYVTELGFTG